MLPNAKIKAIMLPPFKKTSVNNLPQTAGISVHCQDIPLRPYTGMDALLDALSKRFFYLCIKTPLKSNMKENSERAPFIYKKCPGTMMQGRSLFVMLRLK